jgi:hypothetical protein
MCICVLCCLVVVTSPPRKNLICRLNWISNPSRADPRRRQTLVSAIYNVINSIWNKKEMPDQWKESIIVPFTKKTIKQSFW